MAEASICQERAARLDDLDERKVLTGGQSPRAPDKRRYSSRTTMTLTGA